jgi:hypothetical protein
LKATITSRSFAEIHDLIERGPDWNTIEEIVVRLQPAAIRQQLAYQAFKMHRNVVPLANAVLRSVSVSHDAKVRALRRLEADGMIAVDWRGGRNTRAENPASSRAGLYLSYIELF